MILAIFPLTISSVVMLFKANHNTCISFTLLSIGIIILFANIWQRLISQKKP